MDPNNRRFGKFYIKAALVDSGAVFNIIHQMQFVPTRVEFLYHLNAFEYLGMSYTFDNVPENEIAPVYTVMVQDSGQVRVAKETMQ